MIMVQYILQFFQNVPPSLVIILLALTPIIELRGAVPVALSIYQMSVQQALFLAVVGNMIPAFIILYGWDSIISLSKKHWSWLHETMTKIESRTQGKWDKKIERYGPVALAVFVAIPLPMSGVWTGALAAWLFSLSKPKALLSIFVGVLIASMLVAALTFGGLEIFNHYV